jgi:hypothetical protein
MEEIPLAAQPRLRWVYGLLIAGFGTLVAIAVGLFSLVMLAFAFDSPLRKTSPSVVVNCLGAGIGGAIVGAWLVGLAVVVREESTKRKLLNYGLVLSGLAGASYLGYVYLAFFGG